MPINRLIQNIREGINLRIYGKKNRAIQILRILRVTIAAGLLGLLIYHYGFPQTGARQEWISYLVRGSFYFFIFSYLIRLFFEFKPLEFLKQNKWEGLLLLALGTEGLLSLIFKRPLFQQWFDTSTSGYFIFLQMVLLFIVLIEVGKLSQRIGGLNMKPALLFFLSFVILIAIGTGLLLLPEMTTDPANFSWLDAIFTAVSASCVTGLIVVDTASAFTLKGKCVILLLFQLGGLNIISFASFFGVFLRKGVGIRANSMIKDFMSYDSLASTSSMLKRVIIFALTIELMGIILVYISWDPGVYFPSNANRWFHSVFHAISAFTNAGFSTFGDGLFTEHVRYSYVTHIILALLIIAGGIGIPVINDLLDRQRMQQRLLYPWKRLEVNTRLVIYTTTILIVGGMFALFALEAANPSQYGEGGLYHHNAFGQAVTTFFQSVTLRTGGFNTMDFGAMGTPVLLIFILLMFIGASPGGTGGGVKTTTFALVLFSAFATIRGKRSVQIFRSTISSDLMYKAFSIFLFTVSGIFIGIFALSITDPDIPLIQLIFEEVSAFATVGLSTGITSDLSTGGKVVLMLSMLIGRVGVLTVALMVSRKTSSNNYKYPDAYVMLG
jgi:trk system potassium uptake protein